MMKSERKAVLVDSSVLLYCLYAFFEEHQLAVDCLESARRAGWELCVTSQVMRECLVVATGKLQSKSVASVAATIAKLEEFTEEFTVLADRPETFDLLLATIAKYDFRGKRIHDANLVASMLIDRVPCLLTNNPRDFQHCARLVEIIPLATVAEALQ